MRKITIGAIVFFLAFPALGQVYKCKGKSGETVYQQDPCNDAAKPMVVRGTKAATQTSAEAQTRSQVFRSTDLTDAAIAERQWINSSHQAIYGPSNQRVAAYRDQVAALNRQLAATNNNLAGATLASGLHSQLAGLQNAIATEQASASQQASSATQRCADARRTAEQAIEKRYAPPATP